MPFCLLVRKKKYSKMAMLNTLESSAIGEPIRCASKWISSVLLNHEHNLHMMCIMHICLFLNKLWAFLFPMIYDLHWFTIISTFAFRSILYTSKILYIINYGLKKLTNWSLSKRWSFYLLYTWMFMNTIIQFLSQNQGETENTLIILFCTRPPDKGHCIVMSYNMIKNDPFLFKNYIALNYACLKQKDVPHPTVELEFHWRNGDIHLHVWVAICLWRVFWWRVFWWTSIYCLIHYVLVTSHKMI